MTVSIWVGFDPRETAEFAVAKMSVERHGLRHWHVNGLVLNRLKEAGLYTRPMEMRPGVDRPIMWDVISDAPMSTQHACSRFLVPYLAKQGARIKYTTLSGQVKEIGGSPGWALFMDGDMMVRQNMTPLFAKLDQKYAIYCVHHKYEPPAGTKMDGQPQTQYGRKNWSSFLIFNPDHPANDKLTVEMVNTLPGRDLHRFCWLEDRHIGELDQKWNFLVGHTDPAIDPANVHWTSGTPAMKGYENAPFADEWNRMLEDWALGSGEVAMRRAMPAQQVLHPCA